MLDSKETDQLVGVHSTSYLQHLFSSLWLLFDDQLVLQTMDSQRDDYFTGKSLVPVTVPTFLILFSCGPDYVGHSFAYVAHLLFLTVVSCVSYRSHDETWCNTTFLLPFYWFYIPYKINCLRVRYPTKTNISSCANPSLTSAKNCLMTFEVSRKQCSGAVTVCFLAS